ncbi:MAG: glycoside hydrolase family 19 protein [Bacteroidales bacterium]|nr:glycoside hydrolase family 19 protein [Bacteroidales bacterium]
MITETGYEFVNRNSRSFGNITDERVKKWQRENNLSPDGIVGDITWEKMFPGSGSQRPDILSSGTFNLETLKGNIPDAVIAQIPETAAKFNITSPLRLTHFLAQCSHESAGFTRVFENLNYSAEGLMKTFRKYFTDELSVKYARNPAAIGARVYANRMGNGDEASGEGYKFRGRGYIQLTGKSNYAEFGAFIGVNILENPDLVATKFPLASAAFFFNKNNLWTICDQGTSEEIVTKVTIAVNNGINGLSDRVKHFNEYLPLLT